MLITDQYLYNKSIVVSVLGVPNVGKSSLVNSFLGFDLSIVTNKPQTTRNKINCIAKIDETEIVFIDTPGIHSSRQEINIRMNGQAVDGSEGSDLNLLLLDLTRDMTEQVLVVKKNIKLDEEFKKTWVVFTKLDLVENKKSLELLPNLVEVLKQHIPSIDRHFVLSTKTEENLHELTGALLDLAPNSPHLYPGGELSNKNERFFVKEYIREAAFELLKEEIPYETAVILEDFTDYYPGHDSEEERHKERKGRFCEISATILVNRPSQRGIVVGAGGQVIKEIGIRARTKIEKMISGKVHLNLHVKVTPKWFNNNKILEELDLPRVQGSKRVWRQR